jgi:spermidine synthase
VRRWAYPALAFATGTAVTVFEFAAPNLFRGYFGQTIYVWANVIGVILGALALGYALGGRWADRTSTALPLVGVLAFAGLYGLFIAWLGPMFSAWLAGPDEYTQDTAIQAFVAQSLAASLVLFGPPLVALGMATPLMVQRAARADWPVGRAAGVIFGVGTVGSITGIYLTTFFFIEWWGVRATITVAGATLLLLAVAGYVLIGRRRVAVACLVGVVLAPLGVRSPWGALPPKGSELVLAIESPYQLIRVVDRPPGEDGRRERWLAFDEGMGTYHSMEVNPDTKWTGAYYDAFAHLPEWVGRSDPFRVCILGNAAGTMAELLHLHNDATRFAIDAIEIDPAVTEAAREAMGLRSRPDTRIRHADGRTFLASRPEGTYDAIVLDAYARQVSIPAALATKEFFATCRSRLRPGGILFVNLGALRAGGELVRVISNTVHAGFGTPVFRAPLANTSNVLIVAARDAEAPPPPPGSQMLIEASFGRHLPGGMVLTDDYCPVESLTAHDLMLDE